MLPLSPEFQAYSLLLEPSGKTKREFIPQEKGFYVLISNWLREDYKLSLGLIMSDVYNKSMTRVFKNPRNASSG